MQTTDAIVGAVKLWKNNNWKAFIKSVYVERAFNDCNNRYLLQSGALFKHVSPFQMKAKQNGKRFRMRYKFHINGRIKITPFC